MKYTGLSDTPGLKGVEGDEYESLITKKKYTYNDGQWLPVHTILEVPIPKTPIIPEPTVPTPVPVKKPRKKKEDKA